ncbi:MAG: CRISPR-associated protein Cas5, partial [Candidatus Aenigmatarchaeota archaeon]
MSEDSKNTLFVEIFQPFAQYRNPFTFYYAQTYPLPPKSTILGMLQNAVEDWYGINLKDDWDNLKVSIHGGFESIFWNFQNLIKGEISISQNHFLVNKHDDNVSTKIGTWLPLYGEGLISKRVPVYQQELFNGHLFLFLKGSESLINKMKECLEKPRKILYLGRSEDIIFIKVIRDIGIYKKEEVRGDIKLTFPTYIKIESQKEGKREVFPIKMKKYPVYSIPTKIIFKNNGTPVKNKSEISESTEREVEFETVIYT